MHKMHAVLSCGPLKAGEVSAKGAEELQCSILILRVWMVSTYQRSGGMHGKCLFMSFMRCSQ
jgi:hypothetical protein